MMAAPFGLVLASDLDRCSIGVGVGFWLYRFASRSIALLPA
jgi:hypothetical protein